jgi:hypothetical protein
MIQSQSTLGHHLFQIAIAERITQVPAQIENDDFVPKMSTAEYHRSFFVHASHPNKPNPICLRHYPFLCYFRVPNSCLCR